MGSKNIWKMNPKVARRRKKPRTFRQNITQMLSRIAGRYCCIFVGLIAIIAGYGIFLGLRTRFFAQDADSASYYDLLSTSGNARNSSGAYGSSFWDLLALVQSGELTLDSLKVSQSFSNQNPLDSHAYLISSLIHVLNFWPFEISIFPHLVLTLSYTLGLVYIIYYFSKTKPVGLVSHLILMILVVVSPAFYLSLQGQNYMDRLFFGPGIYVVLNLLNESRTKYQNVSIMIVALLSFTISERVSLILGFTIILSMFWRLNQWQIFDSALLAVGFTGVCWYFYWSSKISASNYSSNTSLEVMKDNFFEALNGTRTTLLSLFFLGNAVLLILASFNRKALFIAFISIIPNVLVSVGGAELTGFLTHYHSLYLPILVATAAMGFSNVRLYQLKNKIFIPVLSVTLIIALCGQIVLIAPSTLGTLENKVLYSLGKIGDSFGLTNTEVLESRELFKDGTLSLTRKINVDGITTPPEIMPTLASLGFSNLMHFPMGLGESKFVIASYLDFQMDYPRDSSFGMIPEERIKKWGPILQTILTSSYQKIEQVTLGNKKYVLYEKTIYP